MIHTTLATHATHDSCNATTHATNDLTLRCACMQTPLMKTTNHCILSWLLFEIARSCLWLPCILLCDCWSYSGWLREQHHTWDHTEPPLGAAAVPAASAASNAWVRKADSAGQRLRFGRVAERSTRSHALPRLRHSPLQRLQRRLQQLDADLADRDHVQSALASHCWCPGSSVSS